LLTESDQERGKDDSKNKSNNPINLNKQPPNLDPISDNVVPQLPPPFLNFKVRRWISFHHTISILQLHSLIFIRIPNNNNLDLRGILKGHTHNLVLGMATDMDMVWWWVILVGKVLNDLFRLFRDIMPEGGVGMLVVSAGLWGDSFGFPVIALVDLDLDLDCQQWCRYTILIIE
jgi:hypothetical protein